MTQLSRELAPSIEQQEKNFLELVVPAFQALGINAGQSLDSFSSREALRKANNDANVSRG